MKITHKLLISVLSIALASLMQPIPPATNAQSSQGERVTRWYPQPQRFDVEILVNGRPHAEYFARGKSDVEALPGAEYEIRVTNPGPDRVAVALSVDGLNTIDARHTSAWNASKWVIEPYQTITIGGWQMSSDRARRFYFTNERDSYGAKLGQTADLGVISAVFFKERRRIVPVTPPYPTPREERGPDESMSSQKAPKASGELSRDNRAVAPAPDDEYAATGIGRSVRHDVRWVDMDLESRAAAEVTIRYAYCSEVLMLGILLPQQPREPT